MDVTGQEAGDSVVLSMLFDDDDQKKFSVPAVDEITVPLNGGTPEDVAKQALIDYLAAHETDPPKPPPKPFKVTL